MSHNIIAIGADHAGYGLKTILVEELAALGYQVLDLGTGGEDSVDYPDFAQAVVAALKNERAERRQRSRAWRARDRRRNGEAVSQGVSHDGIRGRPSRKTRGQAGLTGATVAKAEG